MINLLLLFTIINTSFIYFFKDRIISNIICESDGFLIYQRKILNVKYYVFFFFNDLKDFSNSIQRFSNKKNKFRLSQNLQSRWLVKK